MSLAFNVLGVARLRSSRLAAYRWLERSVLVSILFGQVLLFWQDQLAAVGSLAWNLVLLAALRYVIRQEYARQDCTAVSGAANANHGRAGHLMATDVQVASR